MERYLLSVGESGEVVAEAAAVKSAATPRAGGRILENIRLFWVRDQTEEGIEPHPGPRYLSKNVNSVQGDGKLFQMLHSIQREHTRTPITAVFVQDHMQPCTGCNRAALLCSTACRRVSAQHGAQHACQKQLRAFLQLSSLASSPAPITLGR